MAAPTIQNQLPSPGSSGKRADGDIYAEVIDTDSDLKASSVQFWVDGGLAWSGSSAADGWSGARSVVANGYSYIFTPDNPIKSGATITVRVRAEDMVGNVLDTTYTFDTGIFLDSVDKMVISTSGGESMVARGLFTLSGVQIHLGPLGTNQDPLCYGGQGRGYSPASEDGVTLRFASPPLAKGTMTLTVVDGATTLNLGSIKVIERSWPDALHNMRRNFAPWKALGARRLDLENLE